MNDKAKERCTVSSGNPQWLQLWDILTKSDCRTSQLRGCERPAVHQCEGETCTGWSLGRNVRTGRVRSRSDYTAADPPQKPRDKPAPHSWSSPWIHPSTALTGTTDLGARSGYYILKTASRPGTWWHRTNTGLSLTLWKSDNAMLGTNFTQIIYSQSWPLQNASSKRAFSFN